MSADMAGSKQENDHSSIFNAELERRLTGVEEWGEAIRKPFLKLCGMVEGAVSGGATIFICGNGGSAAQAQHFAAEIVGRFKRERRGSASIALTVDTSALTSIANDYGFENVFQRQAEALMHSGDILIGLSTSGTSPNVVKVLQWAGSNGYQTAALTGEGVNEMGEIADVCVAVPSAETDLIQEYHLVLLHILAEVAERVVTGSP